MEDKELLEENRRLLKTIGKAYADRDEWRRKYLELRKAVWPVVEAKDDFDKAYEKLNEFFSEELK